MIGALSSAVSGLQAQQTRLAVTANNVANATTIGFQRSDVCLQAEANGVSVSAISRDVNPGPIVETDRPNDAAVAGPGYFQAVDPDGVITYTRAGAFQMNGAGSLVTPTGDLVSQDGTLQVRTFPNPEGLVATGEGMYVESRASGLPRVAGQDAVLPGALEQSNTDLSDETVGMIVGINAYRANVKSVQTLDSMLRTVINLRR